MSEKSIVECSNVWAENVFEWMYHSCMNSCGDGTSYLICKNYKEAAEWFVKWMNKYNQGKWMDWEIAYHKDFISLWRDQEGFTFSDKTTRATGFMGENIYIIKKDCPFAFDRNISSGSIKIRSLESMEIEEC